MALDKYHHIMPMCIHIAPEAEQECVFIHHLKQNRIRFLGVEVLAFLHALPEKSRLELHSVFFQFFF
jgi:hypothetical protein